MKSFLKVKKKIGNLKHDEFESFCTHLFRKIYKSEGQLHSGVNYNGIGTKGIPDAFIQKSNDKYIVFEFNTIHDKAAQKAKVINDIKALKSDRCHFRDSIEQVIICTNGAVHSEYDEYRKLVKSFGWDYDFHSLDTLATRATENTELFPDFFKSIKQNNPVTETLYDCGDRIKELREERNLLRSELIELIPIKSEKTLESIELKNLECSLEVISRLTEITGADIDWIKHGKNKKYSKEWLYYYGYDEYKKRLSSIPVRNSYFAIEPEKMNLLVILEFTELKWKILEFSFNLQFWEWIDDHHKIGQIFNSVRFFYQTLSRFSYPHGMIIDLATYDELSDQSKFPGAIIKNVNASHDGYYWIEDLFDAVNEFPTPPSYIRGYDKWFGKLVEYFAKSRDLEGVKKA